MPEYYYISAPLLLFLLVIILLLRTNKKWRVKTANRVLKKVNQISHPGAKIEYLRQVDPFVFEEILLSSFRRCGCRIKRNKRYTGDGGVDGRIWINGKKYLIQAKRYRNYINKSHVIEFGLKTKKDWFAAGGLFIHTGKTGKGSWKNCPDNVLILSGDLLLRLIAGDKKVIAYISNRLQNH